MLPQVNKYDKVISFEMTNHKITFSDQEATLNITELQDEITEFTYLLEHYI